VAQIRLDTTAATPRDITLAGLWLRDAQSAYDLTPQALQSLAHLEPGVVMRATMDNTHYATTLAHHMPSAISNVPQAGSLLAEYGAGQAGMSLWLKELQAKVLQGPGLDPDDAVFIDWCLGEAWSRMANQLQQSGINPADTALWPSWYDQNILTPQLAHWAGLGVMPDLAIDPVPYQSPMLICTHPDTLLHQSSQSYSMAVEVGLVDSARSLLAPGQAESDVEFPQHEDDQLALWALGGLKRSPTSYAGIRSLGPMSLEILDYDP